MKTILMLLMIVMSLAASAQRYAVYLSGQPADLGLGVRADLGYAYGSISYGNWGVYDQSYIRNHTKVTIGALVSLKQKNDFKYTLSAGLNYHKAEYPDNINAIMKRTLSYEAGFAIYIRKIAIAARTDIPRWEPCIDIGLNF